MPLLLLRETSILSSDSVETSRNGWRPPPDHGSAEKIIFNLKPKQSMAWPAPSHYLYQCWNIVNWTLGNKLHWNLNRNLYIFVIKMLLNMSSGKGWPFYLGLYVLSSAMWATEEDTAFSLTLISFMMTSSNGNIFRVTGPLCGEFTGPG